MKNLLYILFLLISIPFIGFSQHQEKLDSVSFYKAVQDGMEKYLNKIPTGKEFDFGFNSRDEFREITIGQPLQNYLFQDYSFSGNNDILFKPIQKWTVPLIIKNQYRCFINIILSNDGYKAVGFGLPTLAIDLDNFETRKGFKKIKNKALFIDYALNTYCIVKKDINNNLEFFPFRSINQCESNVLNEKDKYSSFEVFEILKSNNKKLKNEL
ncbi:MAG: hypothetical protein ACM3P1_04195 [Candidatus Saccharibacteria bacterium]